MSKTVWVKNVVDSYSFPGSLVYFANAFVIHSVLSPPLHFFIPPLQIVCYGSIHSTEWIHSKRSTETNLIEFLHHLFINIDSPSCDFLMAFYIDFKKAFDKVNHERLIEKLSSLGIGGACLKLLISYLTNRKQTVRINGTISTVLSVISGVPQGSVLGPLLFLVFINDLPNCSMSDSFGYADDFKIVGTNPVAINIDIRRIWKWCQSNLMEINLSKVNACGWRASAQSACQISVLEALQ